MMRGRNNSAGFTLMEVVVAITLMSLIMMTLVMGLRLTANAWHRGEQKVEERARVMSGSDAMSEQISSAVARIVIEAGANNTPVQVVAFAGSPYELRFCARRSWRGDRSRPQYMAEYRVVKDEQGKQQLVISERALTDDASVVKALHAPAADDATAVGEEADRIELAYYQPEIGLQPGQWLDNWQPLDGMELPRAVQVRWTRGDKVQQATFPIAISRAVRH